MNSNSRTSLDGDRSNDYSPSGAMKGASGRRTRTGPITLTRAAPVVSLLVFLTVWEVFGRSVNPIFASYPTAIFEAGWRMTQDGTLLPALIESMKALALGYIVGILLGVLIGLAIGRFRILEASFGFYVVAGFATPLVALMPLFVLWFGLHFEVKVVVVAVMTVFPVVINTWAGAQAVEKTLVEVGVVFGLNRIGIVRKIVVPASLPFIMTGLRLGVGRAVIAVVIAEFFTAISGLGGLILNAGQRFDTAAMFVPILLLMILGVGLSWLLGVAERAVAPWQAEITKS